MNFSDLTTQTLKSLVKLTDKKEKLSKEIEKIEAQLGALFTGKAPKVSGKRRGRPAKKGVKASKKAPKAAAKAKRSPRGGLGKKILNALDSAGDAGVKVVELAKKIGVKGTNLHIWFATTGKKNPAIKKVGKGHYQLKK
jgi:hypothetical protein